MSSGTDNLDLTKLAQGENFSNAILNQNWEKLDEAIGEIRWVYKGGLGHVTGETLKDKFSRAYDAGTFPINKPFVGHISAGSLCFVAGYLYMSGGGVYGSAIISTFNASAMVRVENGVFMDTLENMVAPAYATGQTNLSETLVNCTGTIEEHVKYHLSGNVIIIEGRLRLSNFVRTSGNPGFSFTLPNGRKAKSSVTMQMCGLTGTTDVPVRFGEVVRCNTTANSGTVTFTTTETINNMQSANAAVFYVNPTVILLA